MPTCFVRYLFVCFLVLLPPVAAFGAELPWLALDSGETARVIDVVDGDTVKLDSGLSVRLVGLQAPKLPLGRLGFKKWPLADRAKTALSGLILDARVGLYYGGQKRDRYGRALAHLARLGADGTPDLWVQGEMLRQGMARVYSFSDNRALVAEMLALENKAREAGQGIWEHPNYQVLTVADTAKRLNRFEVVEGSIVTADIVKGRGYLNFGDDWRSDFTIAIAPRDLSLFRKAGIDVRALAGQRVRVRGWIREYNGPLIEADHPEQIEFIEK
jgi:micrococcal nuclease